jgi:5-methyltetrahydropteroyltriglutamate--homocysteine methyltransferase
MQRSTDRILTTHTGSLPRPAELGAMGERKDQRELSADPRYSDDVRDAVVEIVRKQAECGVDVVNDGEMSKVGYATYVTERLTGFGEENATPRARVEESMFPAFYAEMPTPGAAIRRSYCTGPIAWQGEGQVGTDIANFKAALGGIDVADAFMTAASPGVVWNFLDNRYYPDDEAYMFAVADAMANEYRAITGAGFVLQVDCPDLAMGWNHNAFTGKTVDDFRSVASMHVAALNHALEGIPSDRVRLHLCWGNYEGPHVRDIPLAQIWDIAVGANAGAFSFEGANPRHEHEWAFFEQVRLPDDKILIPGVIDSTTNFVEHPELIAQRIERYAGVVGRENVIAGSDCGFSTFARSLPVVHPSVTWAKFETMTQGARIASERLWG